MVSQLVGRQVGPTGFGLMRMTWTPNPTPDEECFAVLKKALEMGCNFWNSGDFYGNSEEGTENLELLSRYFKKYPEDAEKVVLSVKGVLRIHDPSVLANADSVHKSIERSLRALKGTKSIDIFQPARLSPNVPVEEAVRAIAEHIKKGDVGALGMSECSADSIRRASKIHKVAAVEVEYSLFSTEIRNNGVLDVCQELGIPIVSYSPSGAGFLTGQIKSRDDIPEGDFRKTWERFNDENFDKNFDLVHRIEAIAKKKNVTSAQIAIEWCRQQPNVIPIPGTTKVDRVEENAKRIDMDKSDLDEIEQILKDFTPSGGRYIKAVQDSMYADTVKEEEAK